MHGYEIRDLDRMVETALAALAAGGTPEHRLIDGRVVAVFASPDLGSSADMAMGISALPANYSTPEHSHRAEEFALILKGSGSITIAGTPIPVGPGAIVVTPPNAPHITTADASGPMVIYWTYGPAGSEKRWLDK
jgi:quercetin dioxygenase-like cupin family protein